MQCLAPCGSNAGFDCLTEQAYPTPAADKWEDSDEGKDKKGLLSMPSRENNSSNAWMDFETLNNQSRRQTWLNNAYPALVTAGIIPSIPNLSNVAGNIHGSVDLTPYINDISVLETNLNHEYCYYQIRYYAAVNIFLNNYKNASKESNAPLIVRYQTEALICNNKVNTLIAWMNYLSEKQIINLRSYQSQLGDFDARIKKSSDTLTAQAKILQDNTNSSQLYQEMVKFTTEKNQAHQNLLALYFTLNVVAIASLFVLARAL